MRYLLSAAALILAACEPAPVAPTVPVPTRASAREEAAAKNEPFRTERNSQLAIGTYHVCRLDHVGRVFCWGKNDQGQLGDASVPLRTRPWRVPGIEGAVGLAAGHESTCASFAGGEVRCWGRYPVWTEMHPTPTPVPGLAGSSQLAMGWYHFCARRGGGEVACWSADRPDHLEGGRIVPLSIQGVGDAISLSSSHDRLCALGTDRRVRCWKFRFPMQGPAAAELVEGLVDVRAVEAGFGGGCALGGQGEVWCWAERGLELGDDPLPVRRIPVPAAKAISADDEHACAIATSGRLWCWGDQRWGKLGDGNDQSNHFVHKPSLVTGIDDVTLVEAGSSTTCAERADGGPMCWGYGHEGQLGAGTAAQFPSPVRVEGLPPVRDVAVSSTESCALARDDRMFCWGGGAPSDGKSVAPAPQDLPPVKTVHGAWEHVCAVTKDGNVHCRVSGGTLASGNRSADWEGIHGLRDVEQLGSVHFGSEWAHTLFFAVNRSGSVSAWAEIWDDRPRTPVMAVEGWKDVREVGGTFFFGCGLESSGTLACWETMAILQAGRKRRPKLKPTRHVVAQDVASISGACFVRTSGGVACLGGGDAPSTAPPLVTERSAKSDVLRTSADGDCAVLRDGGIACGAESLSIPGDEAVDIAGRPSSHVCAVTRGGAVWCWGDNAKGAVGKASVRHSAVPVPVEMSHLR